MLTINTIFFVILFFACMISGLVGFGSNILALPLLSLFLDVRLIVPVLVLTVLCNSLPRLVTQYRYVCLPVYLPMVPIAMAGGFAGIHMVGVLHEGYMKLLLASFMLLIAGKGLLEQRGLLTIKKQDHISPVLLSIPFFGGLMQAAFACGGPIFNLFILMTLQQKEQIRATMFAIGATSAAFIALQYFQAGVYQGQVLHFVSLLLPAVFLAFLVSERIFRKINGGQFLQLIYCVLLCTGCITGWQALQLL